MLLQSADPLSLQNLHRSEVLADPYPFYARLREEAPIHWDDGWNAWVLTRYADVTAVLHDERTSTAIYDGDAADVPEWAREVARVAGQSHAEQVLFVDPPTHTRLRGLMHRAFTPRNVEGMRPLIARLTDELLDRVEG